MGRSRPDGGLPYPTKLQKKLIAPVGTVIILDIFVKTSSHGHFSVMQFSTPVSVKEPSQRIGLGEKILVLGSCFADSVGERMVRSGLHALVNPFGTLYNPVSISNSVSRLQSGIPFREEECVRMGAGADLVCSFSHHPSFARASEEEFLLNANRALEEASAFYRECSLVIITLGTAWCFWREGEVVSNCIKRNASEFQRKLLSPEHVRIVLDRMTEGISEGGKRRVIFTVSPVRHLADTAHGNQISKSTLLLGVDSVMAKNPSSVEYFPSYAIKMDELRDYRFYDADMVHPSDVAVEYIWERFRETYFTPSDIEKKKEAERAWKRSRHRPMH